MKNLPGLFVQSTVNKERHKVTKWGSIPISELVTCLLTCFYVAIFIYGMKINTRSHNWS